MTDTATNDTGGTPLDAALAYARHGWRVLPIRPGNVVSEQVPSLTPVTLRAAVHAWDNGPLHVQHNDPGRAGKRNRGPEPDKGAPMGTSYSSGVGGQESDTIVTQEEIDHLATMTWGDVVWHDELGRGEILDLCTFTTWAKVRFASGDHIIHDVTTLRHHVDSSTCDLYRFYDAAGTLLYVGISLHAAVRSSQHRRDKPWWPLAARMEIEHLPNRDEALMAERRVIWTERPLHNVVNANDQPIETFTLPPEAERWGSDTGFVSYGQHRPAREQVVVPKCGHCGRKHKHGVLPHELERGWMDRYPHCSGLFAVDNVPWQRIYFPVKEAR